MHKKTIKIKVECSSLILSFVSLAQNQTMGYNGAVTAIKIGYNTHGELD
jgi:hypothetical protein